MDCCDSNKPLTVWPGDATLIAVYRKAFWSAQFDGDPDKVQMRKDSLELVCGSPSRTVNVVGGSYTVKCSKWGIGDGWVNNVYHGFPDRNYDIPGDLTLHPSDAFGNSIPGKNWEYARVVGGGDTDIINCAYGSGLTFQGDSYDSELPSAEACPPCDRKYYCTPPYDEWSSPNCTEQCQWWLEDTTNRYGDTFPSRAETGHTGPYSSEFECVTACFPSPDPDPDPDDDDDDDDGGGCGPLPYSFIAQTHWKPKKSACHSACDVNSLWAMETSPTEGESQPEWEVNNGGSTIKYTAVDSEDCGGKGSLIQTGKATRMFRAEEDFILTVRMLTNHEGRIDHDMAGFKIYEVAACCTGVCDPICRPPEECCTRINEATGTVDPNGTKIGVFLRWKGKDGKFNCPCGYAQNDPASMTLIEKIPEILFSKGDSELECGPWGAMACVADPALPNCLIWNECLISGGRWRCGENAMAAGGCHCECIEEGCVPADPVEVCDNFSSCEGCVDGCGCACKEWPSVGAGAWLPFDKFYNEGGQCVFDVTPRRTVSYSNEAECLCKECGEDCVEPPPPEVLYECRDDVFTWQRSGVDWRCVPIGEHVQVVVAAFYGVSLEECERDCLEGPAFRWSCMSDMMGDIGLCYETSTGLYDDYDECQAACGGGDPCPTCGACCAWQPMAAPHQWFCTDLPQDACTGPDIAPNDFSWAGQGTRCNDDYWTSNCASRDPNGYPQGCSTKQECEQSVLQK